MKMKKMIAVPAALCVAVALFAGCSSNNTPAANNSNNSSAPAAPETTAPVVSTVSGGNVENVNLPEVASTLYSQDEINAAIEVITTEFAKDWSGCTLKEIAYAGDEATQDHQDWADRNNADEVIVLTSTFDVDSSGGNGSLNPNTTYDNWNWILVRSAGGAWQHVDHGY